MILFDTNIFIDMLNGVHQASIELSSYGLPAISFVTYMELRCGEYARPAEKAILDPLLGEFRVFPMDARIMEAAIEIRGKSLLSRPAIKLLDAIIAATARVNSCPVVTRNPKDFVSSGAIVHVPYDYDAIQRLVTNIRPPLPRGSGTTPTRVK